MSKTITPKFEYVDGSVDTDTVELVCVGKHKYRTVDLCFSEGANIQFARIRLHSNDRFTDADAVYDDAVKLGEEIAKRWNAYRDTSEQ